MAEKFLEPQNPLKKIDETTGDVTYVYPLTTDKQVIMSDGTRLNTILTENILYLGESEDEMSVAPMNADTLGGVAAEEYATKEYVNNNSISTYIHSTGKLTGSGENGKFKATVSETVSSITVNGTACSVNCGGENSIELVKDCWYTFILDGTSINFKGGGGLSNSKLALATATAADVLSGKTFYSGDKGLKTGTRNIGDKISQTVTASLSQNAETNKTYTLTFSNLSKIDGINAMSFSVANRLVLYSFSISGNTISATFHNSSSASKTGSLSITAFQLI